MCNARWVHVFKLIMPIEPLLLLFTFCDAPSAFPVFEAFYLKPFWQSQFNVPKNLHNKVKLEQTPLLPRLRTFRPEVSRENRLNAWKACGASQIHPQREVPFNYNQCLNWWNWCEVRLSWCSTSFEKAKIFRRTLAKNFVKSRKVLLFRHSHRLRDIQVPWFVWMTNWLHITGRGDVLLRQ